MTGAALALTLALVFVACHAEPPASNPLLDESPLVAHAPRFDRIRPADVLPALRRAMAAQDDAIRAIADEPDEPTFANTIVAYDRARLPLEHVQRIIEIYTTAGASPEITAIAAAAAPLLAEHDAAITTNGKLLARMQTLHDESTRLHLAPEDDRLLSAVYGDLVRGGALLSADDQLALGALDTEASVLEAEYTRRLAADIEDTSAFSGDGSEIPDRGLREVFYRATSTRGRRGNDHDTRFTIARLAQNRARRAALLGSPSYAALHIRGQVAGSPLAASAFLDEIAAVAVPRARTELAVLQARADAPLAPWDVPYYMNLADTIASGPDELPAESYFDVDRVLEDGVFYVAHALYGLAFVRRPDLPVYAPGVSAWEVREADGHLLGLFYADLYTRPGKQLGAWTMTAAPQSLRFGTTPIMVSMLNFIAPLGGAHLPLTRTDVLALFHECGHALDGLLSQAQSPLFAGTTTPHDFVELPSQFMQSWAFEPSVVAHYARAPKTGAPMPAALVARLQRPAAFGPGIETLSIVEDAYLDLAWHSLPASAPLEDVDLFEPAILRAHGVDVPAVPPTMSSAAFAHIWTNGYAASYYGYLWAAMYAANAHAWVVAHGGLTRANGQRFRDLLLARGSAMDARAAVEAFLGGPATVAPLLDQLGLAMRDQ